MAELAPGPQPSTAVGSSSADGHLLARLPQAQAENILASLAGRSSSSGGAVPGRRLVPGPPGAPVAGPDQTALRAHRAAGHDARPGPAGANPRLPDASPRSKPHGTPATVARPGHVAPVTAATAAEAGDPSSTDILPDKPKSRFRFRFR
ncbi:MAG: hypothetical protein ABSE77_08020 [Acidimicrobiales bacterium]